MTGSRRILLALLLASVTCVVVVQVTMDNWNLRSGSLTYTDSEIKPELDLFDRTTKPNLPTKSAVIERTMLLHSTAPDIIPKETSSSSSSIAPVPSKSLQKTHSPTVKVRRLPLMNKSRNKQQLLMSRNDRMQEILKQSGVSVRIKNIIDPTKNLKSIPVVDFKNVTRILLVTYFRSGSSFLGDLLQQNWKTFYQFEPLHSMTYDIRIDDSKMPGAFNLLNSIFRCNSTGLKEYFRWVSTPQHQFLFAHNNFLWATCRASVRFCFNRTFVDSVCKRAPVQVIKMTRLHMRQLKSFLQQNPDLNMKVVYLTRDPRGIISSRWSLNWCNDTQCYDPGALCREMADDIKIFEELRQKEPSKFVKVRYEDMSLNPEVETKRLFEFLSLPFSQSVRRFLKTHTVSRKTDSRNPYSTRRNTTAMAYSWRERFTFEQVKTVQSACDDVLLHLNHSFIVSPDQLPFPQGIPHKNVTKTVNKEHFPERSKPRNGKSSIGTNLTNAETPQIRENVISYKNVHKNFLSLD